MTLAKWLSDHDYEWRSRLAPVRLVIETDFSVDEIRTAQSKYGPAASELVKNNKSPTDFIRRYPARTLVILVGHAAAVAYDQGKCWESFWDELGMPRSEEFEAAIRQNTVWLLDKFSLARLPNIEKVSDKKYVMMCAPRPGMPAHCVGDLLAIINQHSSQGHLTNGAALMASLDEPGKEYRADNLDVPVHNFLRYGAEFAVDILDRIIEFVEELAANAAIFELEFDSSTTGLPSVLLDELISQLRDAPVRENRPRSFVKIAGQPAVTYDTDDDEIVLVLPPPPPDGEPVWRVSFDGQVRDVHNARKWGSDSDAPAWRRLAPRPVRKDCNGKQRTLPAGRTLHGQAKLLSMTRSAEPLCSPHLAWTARGEAIRGQGAVNTGQSAGQRLLTSRMSHRWACGAISPPEITPAADAGQYTSLVAHGTP